jgi:hypothetical protein
MKVLALSGSLRAASVHSALLRAAARLAPTGISVQVQAGLGALPLFNPDLELPVPQAVAQLRAAVAEADALLIASPEYAHGITGVMKNLLDWLVSFEPFVHKPVALFSASPRSRHADAALRETLKTMSARIVEGGCFSAQLVGADLGEDEMLQSPTLASGVRAALLALKEDAAAEPAATGGSPTPIGLYEASVPVYLRYLGRLRGLVDIAELHSHTYRLDASELLNARLAPDMLPFEKQVVIAANFALRACFPLVGLPIPASGEFAAGFEGLRSRIDRVTQWVNALEVWQFEGAESRVLESQAGDALVSLRAPEFLFQYALPNFFFHLTAAYTILRSRGVGIGKQQFDGFHAYPPSMRLT